MIPSGQPGGAPRAAEAGRWSCGTVQPCHRGFTLLEIMIVVGIMGIVLAMGVPIVYKVLNRAPMTQAVADVVEVCGQARRQAILQGRPVLVVFNPRAGTLTVQGGLASTPPQAPGLDEPFAAAPAASPAASPGHGNFAKLPDGVSIDMLDINKLYDFKDEDWAPVRFRPDGTCDEMTLILRSDRGEQFGINLEITTGLANRLNEADLQKFRRGEL